MSISSYSLALLAVRVLCAYLIFSTLPSLPYSFQNIAQYLTESSYPPQSREERFMNLVILSLGPIAQLAGASLVFFFSRSLAWILISNRKSTRRQASNSLTFRCLASTAYGCVGLVLIVHSLPWVLMGMIGTILDFKNV